MENTSFRLAKIQADQKVDSKGHLCWPCHPSASARTSSRFSLSHFSFNIVISSLLCPGILCWNIIIAYIACIQDPHPPHTPVCARKGILCIMFGISKQLNNMRNKINSGKIKISAVLPR